MLIYSLEKFSAPLHSAARDGKRTSSVNSYFLDWNIMMALFGGQIFLLALFAAIGVSKGEYEYEKLNDQLGETQNSISFCSKLRYV